MTTYFASNPLEHAQPPRRNRRSSTGSKSPGGVLWGLSMISFWVILLLLKEYSVVLEIALDVLSLLIELLALFLG